MQESLIKLFMDNKEQVLTMQQIYNLFPDYYKLTKKQLTNHPKYPYPLYHHELRGLISHLVKTGIIERPDNDAYIYYSK